MFAVRADSPPVLVGQSFRIRQVLQLIQKLGRSRSPVLVLGETGTGKEVVARAIHHVVPAGPFVPIDCSALVGPLMESELFGHTKGAFTGAATAKIGLVEAANGGTAFFDEIGELPLDLQAKLLRLLQEKEFRPVGSVERRKADFRVIAATNRDLVQEVERGRFRRDLYYRLNVITLRVPPLRERKEDIPALVGYFLRLHGGNCSVSRECLDAMIAYDWPGNVRELENCVQRMSAVNSGPLLQTADLPTALHTYMEARRAGSLVMTAVAVADVSVAPAPPVLSLSEVEKRTIREALDYTKGDRVMAARLLGIGRTTLYRKIKEYRLTD
ncbi:MAG TPA: sigma-54 dependent transcriptional regulator [Bryobacteraceae bacterium]|nr:sigma-54 dependent transcriptional regulator [Bryobacteraceae bacterium]